MLTHCRLLQASDYDSGCALQEVDQQLFKKAVSFLAARGSVGTLGFTHYCVVHEMSMMMLMKTCTDFVDRKNYTKALLNLS